MEDVKKKVAAKLLGISEKAVKVLGSGAAGTVFTGSNNKKVVKITRDRTEAAVCLYLVKQPQPEFPTVEEVRKLGEDKWAILKENCPDTNQESRNAMGACNAPRALQAKVGVVFTDTHSANWWRRGGKAVLRDLSHASVENRDLFDKLLKELAQAPTVDKKRTAKKGKSTPKKAIKEVAVEQNVEVKAAESPAVQAISPKPEPRVRKAKPHKEKQPKIQLR